MSSLSDEDTGAQGRGVPCSRSSSMLGELVELEPSSGPLVTHVAPLCELEEGVLFSRRFVGKLG